jgi:OmpA-OmpF porin, OOP family
MNHKKIKLGLIGITIASVSVCASAADTDTSSSPSTSTSATTTTSTTTSESGSYGHWDTSTTDRPYSWIPYTSYGYFGFGLGQAKYDMGGQCASGFSCNNRDFAFKVYSGGNFSRLFGMEVGYWNLGRARAGGGEIKAQGANIDGVVNLPLGDRFNLFAKGGGVYGWTKTSSEVPFADTGDKNGFDWTYGAGAQFDVTRGLAIRADWDVYRLQFASGDHQDNLYTAGLVYKF